MLVRLAAIQLSASLSETSTQPNPWGLEVRSAYDTITKGDAEARIRRITGEDTPPKEANAFASAKRLLDLLEGDPWETLVDEDEFQRRLFTYVEDRHEIHGDTPPPIFFSRVISDEERCITVSVDDDGVVLIKASRLTSDSLRYAFFKRMLGMAFSNQEHQWVSEVMGPKHNAQPEPWLFLTWNRGHVSFRCFRTLHAPIPGQDMMIEHMLQILNCNPDIIQEVIAHASSD